MFCSWLKTRDQVLPSKDTWVQLHTNQNAINTGVHSSQQNNLYSQVGSKHFNNVPWQRQGMLQHDLLGISVGEGRDETSKSRTTIKYMCTHPHLSLSLYINTYFLHLNFTALLSWQRMVKFLLSWALLSVLCTLLEIFFGGGVLLSKLSCLNAHLSFQIPLEWKKPAKLISASHSTKINQLREHHKVWAVPGMWDFAGGDTNTSWFGMLIWKHPRRGQKCRGSN